MMLMVLVAASCGEGTATSTAVQASGSLSGVHFEVRENPG
jgi:hypothetical protein